MYHTAIVSKIAVVSLTLLSTIMINRCLGVALKGEYAYIINWTSILVTIFSLGIGQTYSTYRRKFGKEPLNTFVALTIIQTLIIGLLATIAKIIGASYDICWILLITTFSVARSNILYLSAIEDIQKRDYHNIIYKVIYTILISIAFFLNTNSLSIMLTLYVIDEIITIGGCFIHYHFKPDFHFIRNSKTPTSKAIMKIYSLGFISMLMFLMINLNYNLDIIMLEHLSDNYSVGLYSVGVNLANLLFLIPDAFKDVLFHKTAKSDSIKDIVLSIKANILIDIILIVGFLFLGKPFISILYGEDFIGAFTVTIVLFLGSLSMVLYKMIHPLYISNGKQRIVFRILLVSVILNAIANIFLIPLWNITGAAIASVISYTACSVIFLMVFCKDYHIVPSQILIIRRSEIGKVKRIIQKKFVE